MRAARPRRAATCATARPWLPALAATRVRSGLLPQRPLDRPGRAQHLECGQAEAVGLVLERDRAEAQLAGNGEVVHGRGRYPSIASWNARPP